MIKNRPIHGMLYIRPVGDGIDVRANTEDIRNDDSYSGDNTLGVSKREEDRRRHLRYRLCGKCVRS